MKSILSTALIVIGACLTVVGYIFNTLDLPDSFQGLYSGPIILIVGIVLYIFKVNARDKKATYISSRVTFVYKILIPIVGGIGLTIYFIWALDRGEQLDLFIPLGLFFMFLWVVMVIIGIIIVEVRVYDDTIEIVNYATRKSISINGIKGINRFLINFYKISFRDGTNKIFIPHISEVLLNPLLEPKSITTLKKYLRDRNVIG